MHDEATSQAEIIGHYRVKADEHGNLRQLGEGYTARVYRAVSTITHEEVALKVMKRGLPSAMQERFKLEAAVLSRLHASETKAEYRLEAAFPGLDVELPAGHSFIVGLRGMDLDHDPPYIALELLQGKTVMQWLAERQRPLREQTALRIGWQFCHVLRLLHQDLRRSYTDMKLDNTWWDGEWIRVSDWNIVSEVGEADVEQDLLTFGKHLYRMVTGVVLGAEERGLGKDRLVRLAGDGWEQLSEGMRDVLRRVLHRNREERYPTAQSLGRALWSLSKAWGVPADDLAVQAGRLLSGEPTFQEAHQATVLLDIARRRADGNKEVILKLTRFAEQLLQAREQALDRGSTFWRAGDYRSAMDALREAAEEGEGELAARRLLGLAQLGVERPTDIRRMQEQLEEGLQALGEGWYERAEQIFEHTSEQIGELAAIADLEREARSRRLVERAEQARGQQRPQEAAQAYADAWDALRDIENSEYRQALAEELPDLGIASQQAFRRARSVLESRELAKKGGALLDTDVEQGARLLRQGLEKDPGNETIPLFCLEKMQTLARKGQLDSALVVGEAAILGDATETELARTWRAIWQLREAEQLLLAHRLDEAIQAMKDFFWWEQAQLYDTALELLQKGVRVALDAQDYGAARELVTLVKEKYPEPQGVRADSINNLMNHWYRAWSQELGVRLKQAREERDQEQAERVKRLADDLLAQISSDDPRYREVSRLNQLATALLQQLQFQAGLERQLDVLEAGVPERMSMDELEQGLARCTKVEVQAEGAGLRQVVQRARTVQAELDGERQRKARAPLERRLEDAEAIPTYPTSSEELEAAQAGIREVEARARKEGWSDLRQRARALQQKLALARGDVRQREAAEEKATFVRQSLRDAKAAPQSEVARDRQLRKLKTAREFCRELGSSPCAPRGLTELRSQVDEEIRRREGRWARGNVPRWVPLVAVLSTLLLTCFLGAWLGSQFQQGNLYWLLRHIPSPPVLLHPTVTPAKTPESTIRPTDLTLLPTPETTVLPPVPQTPVPSKSPTSLPTTNTPPPTHTPSQTSTPTVTLTETPTPTPTVTPVPPQVKWVEDVTVFDGTQMQPGEEFTKTWRFQNIGAVPLGEEVRLVFVPGTIDGFESRRMGGPEYVSVPNTAPGERFDISVRLIAPQEQERHRSYWQLQLPNGERLENVHYADIVVSP
jgi:hypothetical protein